MWNPFRASKPESLPEKLFFKSGRDAFEYASQYMTCPMIAGSRIYGLIESIRPYEDELLYDVRLANKDQTLLTDGCSLWDGVVAKVGLDVAPLKMGDFVMIEIIEHVPGPLDIVAFLIMARVKPIWSFEYDVFLPDLPEQL